MACIIDNDIQGIVQGDEVVVLVTVEYPAGSALAITGTVTAKVMSKYRDVTHVADFSISSGDSGNDWSNGVVAVPLTDVQTTALPPGEILICLQVDQASIGGMKTFWSKQTVLRGAFV